MLCCKSLQSFTLAHRLDGSTIPGQILPGQFSLGLEPAGSFLRRQGAGRGGGRYSATTAVGSQHYGRRGMTSSSPIPFPDILPNPFPFRFPLKDFLGDIGKQIDDMFNKLCPDPVLIDAWPCVSLAQCAEGPRLLPPPPISTSMPPPPPPPSPSSPPPPIPPEPPLPLGPYQCSRDIAQRDKWKQCRGIDLKSARTRGSFAKYILKQGNKLFFTLCVKKPQFSRSLFS